MDVMRQLPKSIKVQEPSGRMFEQDAWYDWKTQYCAKCVQLGHVCPERKEPIPKQTKPKILEQVWQPRRCVVEPNRPTNEKQLLDKQEDSFVDHSTPPEVMQREGKQPETWQTVKAKSAEKGNLTKVSEVGIITNNGFDTLGDEAGSSYSEGRMDIGCQTLKDPNKYQ